MLEPWRSQYLQALGVEVYVPRFPISAAAPATEIEWDDVIADAFDQPIELDEPIPVMPLRRSTPSVEELLDVEPVRASSARTAPAPTPTVAGTTTPKLRIKLIIAASDSGVLIVDDATNIPRNDSQRLLANLLFALQGKPANLKVETFDWPLPNLRNRAIELNEDAARETLSGLLQRKILDGEVRTILLLGDNAQRWIDASLRQVLSTDKQLAWGVSISSSAVLGDLQLKRQWWLDLRSIATH